MEVTQELLLELMEYEEETGRLWWKPRKPEHFTDGVRWSAEKKCARWNHRFAGEECGTLVEGYKASLLMGRRYGNHRLIWMMGNGVWPDKIDHIDGVKLNNRRKNLREVTVTENNQNACMGRRNTSGVVGVSWIEARKYWRVQIGRVHVGCFRDFGEAVRARKNAEKEHGYHENHGRESSVC